MAGQDGNAAGRGSLRHRGRSAAGLVLAVILASAGLAGPALTSAGATTDRPGLSDSGWRNVTAGMRHFTGLTCPDRIGSLSRLQVLASSSDRIAGCVYQSDTGIAAILRSHPPGESEEAARSFAERYAEAGFPRMATSGAAASGLTVRTGEDRSGTRVETLWRFHTRRADYTLWMSYALPLQADAIGPLVAAFATELAEEAP